MRNKCWNHNTRDAARFDSFRRIYGDKVATKVIVPTETITEGLKRIDGVTYDFKRFVDAKSDFAERQLLAAKNSATDAYSTALSAAATLALAAGGLGSAPPR